MCIRDRDRPGFLFSTQQNCLTRATIGDYVALFLSQQLKSPAVYETELAVFSKVMFGEIIDSPVVVFNAQRIGIVARVTESVRPF